MGTFNFSKISVSCTRELDVQGLAGYVLYMCYCFVGVGFWMALGMVCLLILGWFWETFGIPKSIKIVIDFTIDF